MQTRSCPCHTHQQVCIAERVRVMKPNAGFADSHLRIQHHVSTILLVCKLNSAAAGSHHTSPERRGLYNKIYTICPDPPACFSLSFAAVLPPSQEHMCSYPCFDCNMLLAVQSKVFMVIWYSDGCDRSLSGVCMISPGVCCAASTRSSGCELKALEALRQGTCLCHTGDNRCVCGDQASSYLRFALCL